MHWYTRDGKTAYGAGLKDARQNNLLPSVTEILNIEKNYGLELYKQNQLLDACIDTIDEYACTDKSIFKKVVINKSRQHSKRAMKIGNIIHHMIANYIREKPFYLGTNQEIHNIFNNIKNWIDNNLILGACEQVVVSEKYGYAGTCDYVGELVDGRKVRIDWKCRNIKHPGFKKNGELKKAQNVFYDNDCAQLISYEVASIFSTDIRMSVVIGTNPDYYSIHTKEWSYDDELIQFKRFLACTDLFYIKHKL